MSSSDREHELGRIIAEFLKAAKDGAKPDRETLLARHPDLADDLQSFLANHDQMHAAADAALGSQRLGPLDPTLAPHGSDDSEASSSRLDQPGRKSRPTIGYFGDYELLAEVARGGMGVVFRARQVNLDRIVAIKMILTGQLASDDDVRRFYQEAEAAANLEHPGIVPIFEVGQHEGQHFFSMGYVDGPNLAQVLADGPLPPRDGAVVVKLVAEAIAFAHDRGVIHRDLKPANVLLARLDGSGNQRPEGVSLRPGTSGATRGGYYQPKVTDFGLAKRAAADEGGLTATGQILGTPSYMPPEQASGRISDVGVVSDVYSLGAILYVALTGHPPFQSDTPLNVVRQVLEQEPISPRQSNPAVPRDLETICLKCLEKDRCKRYASARELAEELQRYLNGEPIRARRISSLERGWRWCKRKPAVAALWFFGAAVLLTLAIGGPLLALKQREIATRESALRKDAQSARQRADEERNTAQQQREIATQEKDRAQRQEEIAARERDRAQRNLAAGQLALGRSALRNHRTAEALNWILHAYLNAPPGDSIRVGARNVIGAYVDEISQTLVHPATVHEVAISPDGKTLWAAYLNSQSQLWDLTTGKPLGKPLPHSGDVVSGKFSPDGTQLLAGDWNGASVYSAATGKLLFQIAHENREDTMIPPEFSPDGLTIATRDTLDSIRVSDPKTGNSIRLWDAKTGKPRCNSLPHNDEVWRIRFSPDSKLVGAQAGDEVRVWNGITGEAVGAPWTSLSDFAFHPDGKTIAICGKEGKDRQVSLRNVADASTIDELAHDEPITRLEFDTAGKNLLGYFHSSQPSRSQTAVVWQNVTDEDRVKVVLRQGSGLGSATISPNGAYVAMEERDRLHVVQSRDGRSLWTESPPASSVLGSAGSFGEIQFSPDGKSLMAKGKNVAYVFSMNNGKLLALEEHLRCSEFSPDGKQVVFGGEFGWARVRSVEAATPRQAAMLVGRNASIRHTTFTSDGKTVVTAGNKQVQFWDAESWQPKGEPIAPELPISAIALSPDDTRILLALQLTKPPTAKPFESAPSRYELWDVASRKRIGEPLHSGQFASRITFDATGKTIAIGSVLYDAQTLERRPTQANQDDLSQIVNLLWWNGARLNGSRPPELWDETAGAPTRLQLPAKGLQSLRLTPGGRLLGRNKQGEIRLWQAADKPLGPLFQIDGQPVFISNSGRYIIAGQDDAVQIWDAYTGKRCGEQMPDSRVYMVAAFHPNDSIVATYRWFHTRFWDCATGIQLGPPMQMTSTGQDDLDFSANGRWLLSTDGSVHVIRVPQPAIDDPQRLRLLVETRTGLRVDENGTLQKLRHNEWHERKRQLEEISSHADIN